VARFLRRFPWIERAFQTQAQAISPIEIVPAILPSVDAFGNEAWQNTQYALVTGALNDAELVHTRVPPNRIRYYSSMEYWMIGIASSNVRAGRVLSTTVSTFPFAAFRDEIVLLADQRAAVSGITVGPNQWIGVQATPAVGINLFLKVVWVETSLGEYLHEVR